MRRLSTSTLTIAVAAVLFALLAPLTADMYNTICHRGFLDLALQGRPYRLALVSSLSYRGVTWPFDFAYPPFTMLFILPGWAVYRLLHSEAVYQVLFKLPLLLSAVATQVLALRLARRYGRTPQQAPLASWYVLLPGVLLATTIGGSFDAVNAMLILLAVYWYEERRNGISALALGLAGALRLYPLAIVPVFLAHLWHAGSDRWRRIAVYAMLSAAPLVLTCAPFIAGDAGFLPFLRQAYGMFGPFSTLNAVAPPLRHLLAPWGYTVDYHTVGTLFLPLALVALVAAYLWVLARPTTPASDSLLVLLVFFLVYPKGQGLYITALIPLALIEPLGVAAWVWVPGTLLMLTVNGALGASGLPYWFAPATGLWQRAVPEWAAGELTVGLSAAQALLITAALVQIARSASRTGMRHSIARAADASAAVSGLPEPRRPEGDGADA